MLMWFIILYQTKAKHQTYIFSQQTHVHIYVLIFQHNNERIEG